MRPGEVAKLTINDIDFGRGVFILRKTKTNNSRLVPIPENIEDDLQKWLQQLKGALLFPKTTKYEPIEAVSWNRAFQERISRLGIKRTNLTPYSLRHSFITRLLEEDVNLFKVQKLVGHRQIKTTAHYTHLTIKDIQRAIRKHPAIMKATSPKRIITYLKEFIESLQISKDARFKHKLETTEDSLKFELRIKKEKK